MKKKSAQLEMFGVEVLPIFSGTPMVAKDVPFDPQPVVRQESLASCRACLDTGRIGKGFCWCDAGVAAKRKDNENAHQ